jgi:outer membrane protein
MKNLLTLTAAFTILAFSTNAHAAEKIATVDVVQVVKKSEAAQNIYKQAEKLRTELQDAATDKEDELRDEERDLVKQRSLIAKDAFEERTKAFKQTMITAQKDLQKRGAQLQKAGDIALSTVKVKIFEIVKEIAESEGFTLVVPKANLLYIKEDADITAKVIEKLNDELDEVELEIK